MARTSQEKYENRRTRSFNLDQAHYDELKALSRLEECSMSDVLNRVLCHALMRKKELEDQKNGIQTILQVHTQDARARENNRKNKKILMPKCNPQATPYCFLCWGDDE